MNMITNFAETISARFRIDDPADFRLHVVRLFRYLGIPALTLFSIDDLLAHRWDEAVFTLAILMVFFLTVRLDITVKQSTRIFRAAVGLLTANFLYLLAAKPDTHAGAMWMFLIPLPVALLFGFSEGTIWIAASDLAALAAMIFSPLHAGVSTEFIVRFGFAYTSLGILALITEFVRGQTQNLYIRKQRELLRLNEKYAGKALLDPLTDVYNREFLTEMLPGIISYSVEAKQPLSVIVCDLDDFKLVNDSHGHVAGDEVLKITAALLQQNLRSGNDNLVRFGGDEFIIFLRNTTLENAVRLADRLREKLTAKVMKEKGLTITCSFGATEMLETDLGSGRANAATRLIARADEFLYRAKSLGKDQVVYREPAKENG